MDKRRNILIFKAVVDVGDSGAVARLLAAIPESAKLEPLIKSRFAETLYDPKTQRDYWIGGDDKHIACLMITGIGMEEVQRIRALFDTPGQNFFDIQELVSHAARVTGGAVHFLN
jgi:hypothetical protein